MEIAKVQRSEEQEAMTILNWPRPVQGHNGKLISRHSVTQRLANLLSGAATQSCKHDMIAPGANTARHGESSAIHGYRSSRRTC